MLLSFIQTLRLIINSLYSVLYYFEYAKQEIRCNTIENLKPILQEGKKKKDTSHTRYDLLPWDLWVGYRDEHYYCEKVSRWGFICHAVMGLVAGLTFSAPVCSRRARYRNFLESALRVLFTYPD